MARRKHSHVYVVELSNDVLLNARFMRSNPDYWNMASVCCRKSISFTTR